MSFPVLFVASIENIFLNSSGKSSLSIICIPSTALIFVDFASPSYWGIVSFIFSISLNWFVLKFSLLFCVIDKDVFDNLYKLFSKLIVDFIMFKHEYKHERTIVKIINIITVLLLFLKIYAIAFFNIFITLLYTYLIDSILFTTLHPK